MQHKKYLVRFIYPFVKNSANKNDTRVYRFFWIILKIKEKVVKITFEIYECKLRKICT